MKYLILSFILIFTQLLSELRSGEIPNYAGEPECYCYQNSENNYIEWLYFTEDSVVIHSLIGDANSSCEDFNMGAISGLKSSGNIWSYEQAKKDIKFTKSIKDNTWNLEIKYLYSCRRQKGGLQVHIEYKPQFQDYAGPPDRFYKKVEI